MRQNDTLLNSPVHSRIRNDKRRRKVENLMAEAAESVENRSVECAGQRVLAVWGDGVCGDSSLRGGNA